MITDILKNSKLYYPLGKEIEKALKYLESADIKSLAEGKYEIDGDNIFVLINIYGTKDARGSYSESHRKFLDIQYVAQGCEIIGYAPLNSQIPYKEYDEEKDFTLYDEMLSFLRLNEGMFAIFFPGELHMPGINDTLPAQVKKAVIKIKMPPSFK